MSNEKPGNQHWSQKLEDSGSIPALLPEAKNAAWQKLHDRLQQKPQRIHRAWYWAAAACILLLCSIPLLLTEKKAGNQNNNSLKNVTVKTVAPVITSPGKKNTLNAKPGLTENSTVKTAIAKPVILKNPKAGSEPISPAKFAPDIVMQTEKTAIATEIISAENKINGPIIAVAVPLKAKLRVVHINELGDAVPERNTARTADDGFIKFKILNQQVSTSTGATAKAISFNISSSTN